MPAAPIVTPPRLRGYWVDRLQAWLDDLETASPPDGSVYASTIAPGIGNVTMVQTAYSTASPTVAAVTTHAVVDSSNGTPSTTALAAQGVVVAAAACAGGATPSAAQVDTAVAQLSTQVSAELVIIRNNISTTFAEHLLAVADLLSIKKNLNSVIDGNQTAHILG